MKSVVILVHWEEERAAVPDRIEVVVDGVRPLALLLWLAAEAQGHVRVGDVSQDPAIGIDQIVGAHDAHGQHPLLALAQALRLRAACAPEARRAERPGGALGPRVAGALGVVGLVEHLEVEPGLALGAVQLLLEAQRLAAGQLLLRQEVLDLPDLQLEPAQEILVEVRLPLADQEVHHLQQELVGGGLHLEDHGRGVPAWIVRRRHRRGDLLFVAAELQLHTSARLPLHTAALAVREVEAGVDPDAEYAHASAGDSAQGGVLGEGR
mmetsp:Transcript_83993/g.246343  ORF Transcript_83993/g.246343 Transcript_83993/m.246343 type:complete len:266 (-) Transcript_83993:1253-2050(-)